MNDPRRLEYKRAKHRERFGPPRQCAARTLSGRRCLHYAAHGDVVCGYHRMNGIRNG